MLYLIGLGLNEKGISLEGKEILKNCNKIYLESYTINFPYKIEELERIIEKKVIALKREDVEGEKLAKEAKKQDIALLVYGSPLFATTHMSLILDCEKQKIKYKVIYSASVFDAVAETGLQLYKFGKITSMPKWQKNFEPDSFLDFVEQNNSIGAHSLILIDIGMDFNEAINQLKKANEKKADKIKMDKLVVCSRMGNDESKIYYGTISELKNKRIIAPYCFIIPRELHFLEKESVERFEV